MNFFDMLFSRYNSPMTLLDNFLSYGLLCEFIDCFLNLINETMAWELWLHKETGKTWGDFKLAVIPQNINTELLTEASESIEKQLMNGECWLDGNI